MFIWWNTIICEISLQNIIVSAFLEFIPNKGNESTMINSTEMNKWMPANSISSIFILNSAIVSKTDGAEVCPETFLCTIAANWGVQVVAFTGPLKDKSTFKGNKQGKMPGR